MSTPPETTLMELIRAHSAAISSAAVSRPGSTTTSIFAVKCGTADFLRTGYECGLRRGSEFVDAEVPSLLTGRVSLVYKLGRSDIANPGSEVTDDHGPKYISYAGVDGAHHAVDYYSGTLVKLNGDFNKNGLILRSEGIIADYNYRATGDPLATARSCGDGSARHQDRCQRSLA